MVGYTCRNFIGLGGAGNILASQTLSNIDAGLARILVGATVFPVGLMLVSQDVVLSYLLVINSLMTLAVMNKKDNIKRTFRKLVNKVEYCKLYRFNAFSSSNFLRRYI